MMVLKTLPAPVTPVMPRIGVLSRFPTQTPTVKSAVKPMHQLSLKSVEVPVFTPQGKGRRRFEWVPKLWARAELSASMLLTSQPEFWLKIRLLGVDLFPPRRRVLGWWTPICAMVAKAFVASSRVTSPLPSARLSP